MEEYITTIGLEIHIQLKTKSKMFCSTSAEYFGAEPNSHTCPVCLGLPGALPVINQKAVESAMKFGLALNCKVGKSSKFDRKNYFYPDLPKGYQISQYDLPIAYDGFVKLESKLIRINRAHLEEDTGKLIHLRVNGDQVSLIDFNRSGVPLMEVVSEPDIESPGEAKAYAKKIHQIARYLEIADVDMEKAGMRFDANISMRPKKQKTFGTKVEIKNINSFKFLERALVFEIERQIKLIKSGGKVIQETRGWQESKGVTVSQRTKETSPDYRYFPEPDLLPLSITEVQIRKLETGLEELPDKKQRRFEETYKLDKFTAQTLTEDKYIAQWYEKALSIYSKNKLNEEKSKKVATWVFGEIYRRLKEKNINIRDIPLEPASLVELLLFVDRGEINTGTAKEVLGKMFVTGEMPAKIIKEENLVQISSLSELESLVAGVLSENKQAVADLKNGKRESIGFIVGQVMKKTQGKANPKAVVDIINKKI
ncbi:MAG: glutaminyl-tRNA synthase (glutamine-hydrolyzing) subunit B [Candidatus Woykebacteria bacterium RIFCSPLOWO2_01_FULL_41_12]|uniref:Aspartyl/glutamyl-tRNA(Asn/Gln) amidotransferase subunit B n=1 Tax=Candidatus Woykebacteria bacterium RIFCSPLOWO2_01_FULL_41_12 TaxID=1802604 RepID=A0A1G1WZF5_9BACT|nr:MAG: glutaminyl-tRNA synthase (glutamine-hydrolyzing) subunit B [Candidatus Woykebacteria bacterium RIFCSPLOWO2_01_FULL_41_12]